MPQWKEVSPDFKGSTHAFGDAMQQINTVAGIPTQLLKDIESQRRYDAEQARQKVADDRATTLFNQSQADRSQQLKDRENRIMFEGLKAELLPHLQSQDSKPMEFDGVLNSIQTIPSNISNDRKYISTPIPVESSVNNKKPVTILPNEKIDYQVSNTIKVPNEYKAAPTVFGIPQSVAKPKLEALDLRENALLNTPGMYRNIPASSVRELTTAGKKELNQIALERKEALRDKSIPKYKNIVSLQDRQTTFNDLDLSKALTRTGQPATKNAKLDEMFVRDKTSNNLVPLSKAMTAGSKIGQATVEKVGTAVGTRTVKGPSLSRIMTDAKQYGMNPEEVKQSYSRIDDGYKQILSLLPKDNTSRREEMRGYLTSIASNLGLDPKDIDINKEVDSILPKIEMSESQKFAANTVVHALDEKKKEIMENKKLALQEKEMLLNQEYRNASLALQRDTKKGETEGKLPPGYTLYVDPKTGEQSIKLLSTVQNAEKTALESKTLKGILDDEARLQNAYEGYKTRNSGAWYNPFKSPLKYTDPASWAAAGRPY